MFNFFVVAARLFSVFASIHLLCCWSAHKSLAPRTRTLLGFLGQATLIFVAVATLLLFFFCECPKFCDLAKQRRKIFVGVSEVGKIDFALYFFWLCVFVLFFFSSAAIARRPQLHFSVADEGVDHEHDQTSELTFEGAPSASGLHASPSPTTTTLPTPDPAATTSTPITTPPMAEGTGFTGMPTYPAYGVDPSTTAFLEATTGSEPVASSSAPRWYAADYHHPLPATGAYVDVPGYATLSGLRRGPESCGSRSRGSGRSSKRSLTRSEINEVLRGATSKIVGDLTQEIRAKLDPLIPPQASPTIVGVSPHRVQANHLVAGLTNTLESLRTRPMPTPAVIPRSPFIPRTAKPPYSHVGNSTRAELDRLGLTALRAIFDLEPYGSSDLGGDPSDLAHANCTLFFTSRAAFVCKKETRSFRVFPPEN